MTERETVCQAEHLDQLSVQQLDALLQAELSKECPEEKVVLPILKELEQREKGYPVELTRGMTRAWERFDARTKRVAPRKTFSAWLAVAAAVVALVCAVFFAIPQSAEADGLLDRLVQLTDSILQFFDPDSAPQEKQTETVFQTEHPGLQQLHRKLTEYGITDPVVPMWLPEGYELTELKTMAIDNLTKICANFTYEDRSVLIWYMLSSEITATQYEVDDKQAEHYEVAGIYHTIVKNGEKLSATWARDRIECLMTVDLESEAIYDIIDSIYRRTH